MAFFKIQVFKTVTGSDREFSNVYRVEAADLNTVGLVLSDLCNQESHIFLDNVTVTRARASDENPATDAFIVHTANIPGDRATADGGQFLPLFNCFRVDLDVVGGGRPSRKYYRGPILEADIAYGLIDAGVRDNIEDQVAQIIVILNTGDAPWVDPDGQMVITPHCLAPVQMRQLHRKRRRTAP